MIGIFKGTEYTVTSLFLSVNLPAGQKPVWRDSVSPGFWGFVFFLFFFNFTQILAYNTYTSFYTFIIIFLNLTGILDFIPCLKGKKNFPFGFCLCKQLHKDVVYIYHDLFNLRIAIFSYKGRIFFFAFLKKDGLQSLCGTSLLNTCREFPGVL